MRNTTAAIAALLAAACSQSGLAQTVTPSILQIDIANHVLYFSDTTDITKYGTDPNPAATVRVGTFARGEAVAEIVAVNGQRVMGTHTKPATGVTSRIIPAPGQAIADVSRNGAAMATFEILKSDGTPIGTIFAAGLAGGDPPPGSPSGLIGGNFIITGGTGAYLGARGQMGVAANPPGVAVQRGASMNEDPANRRANGGGSQRWIAQLIPMSAPQVVTTSSGPAVTHSSDFTPVTASKPAAQGEILSLFVTGLGPTVPAVDPGQPFPSSPAAVVNSPVEVKVNGVSAEVLAAVGYPGSLDGYQVNFRMPSDTAKGSASINVTAAWITGPPVQIAVR